MFRKNTEALEEWSPENVAMCAARQDEILEYADQMLKEGGRLVYSTCSNESEENQEQVEKVLARHPEFTCVDMRESIPFASGCDGAFAAALAVAP